VSTVEKKRGAHVFCALAFNRICSSSYHTLNSTKQGLTRSLDEHFTGKIDHYSDVFSLWLTP
ncbi:MAG: hypothetical protein ABGX39_06175, partial [Methylococcales bacterium]